MNAKQTVCTKNGTLGLQKDDRDRHKIFFYRTAKGREPVREWLKQIDQDNRKRIGEDLYTLQLGWPTGMPLARKLATNLWEFRSYISDGIARIMKQGNRHIGSSLDDFLAEEGLLESGQSVAIKRVLSWQITQFMTEQNLSKAAMAARMNTSRSALDRLLDPKNASVTLNTLQNAARAVGAHLEMKLVFEDRAA